MKGTNKFSVLLLAVCLLSACKYYDWLSAEDYISYVENEENGMVKNIEIDGWKYNIQYKPADYILLHEHNTEAENRERKKQLEGTAWFNITVIQKDGKGSPLRYHVNTQEEYQSRYNYYLYQAGSDISLVWNGDTLHPVSYIFENNYNLAPQETMVAGFILPEKATEKVTDVQLVYKDRLLGTGIIKAKFYQKDISSLPQLISKYE